MTRQATLSVLVLLALVAIAGLVFLTGTAPSNEQDIGKENGLLTSTDLKLPAGEQAPDRAVDSSVQSIATSSSEVPPILTEVDPALVTDVDLSAVLERKPIKQYKIVRVNANLLRHVIRENDAFTPFELELFEERIELFTVDSEERSSGWQSGYAFWRGIIGGTSHSDAFLRINPNGQARGGFQSENLGYVTLESIGESGFHLLWSMDDEKIEARHEQELRELELEDAK